MAGKKQKDQEALSEASIVVAAEGQMSSEVAGEVVILNLESGKYYSLNAVGATIWKLVQKPSTVGDLKRSLLETYDVSPDRCEADLLELLKELRAAGIVEVSGA